MVGRRAKTAVLAASLLVAAPGLAAAEPYLAGFIGAAATQSQDVDTSFSLNAIPIVDGTLKDVDFNTSVVFGGKLGYYFDHPFLGGNFGLELEAYHDQPDVDSQTVTTSGSGLTPTAKLQSADIEVTTVALNLLYRLELYQSDNFPHGRFQPYGGVGLGLFIAELSTTATALRESPRIKDTDVEPGGQVIAGARFFLTPHVAIFAEYKLVQTVEFTFDFRATGTTALLGRTVESARDRAELTQHQVLTGIGFHW